MSTHALLSKVPSPTTEQIAEALSGNICRCGEYKKVFTAVETAAKELRGEEVTYLARAVTVEAEAPAAAPTISGTSKTFEFVNPLATIEEFDPLAEELRTRPGILGVSGNERQVTIRWDPATLTEAQVRQLLEGLRRPVRE